MTKASDNGGSIVIATVLLIALAGCLTEQNTSQGTPELVGFKAIYSTTASDSDHIIELKPPVRILDRDLTHRMAYPLVTTVPDIEYQVDIVFLDSDLRVVREDNLCARRMIENECTHADTDFDRQGALPPLGFFWLDLLAQGNGTLDYSLWLSDLSIRPQITESDKGLILQTSQDAWPQTAGQMGVPGEYHYAHGMKIPERIVKHPSGQTWELVSYEEHGPLPEADVWPKSTQRPMDAGRESLMFPGEDEDPYELDSPPLAALEWLLENDEEAASLMENGCVQRYRTWIHTGSENSSTAGLPRPVLPSNDVSHTISIFSENGSGREWTVDHYQGSLVDEYRIQKDEDPTNPYGFCAYRTSSPAPAISLLESFNLFNTFPVSYQHVGEMEYRFIQMARGGEGAMLNPPEDGLDRYAMIFMPDHVDTSPTVYSYAPYSIEMAAAPGFLTTMRVHPDDLREIDQEWTAPSGW